MFLRQKLAPKMLHAKNIADVSKELIERLERRPVMIFAGIVRGDRQRLQP